MCVATLAFVGSPLTGQAVGSGDGVAVQYYFSGAAALAADANFQQAKAILSTPAAKGFRNFVLDRLTGVYGKGLQLDPGPGTANALRPMLEDLLQAESAGSFGGRDTNRIGFVLAAKLDAKASASWEKNLETALHGKGEALTEEGFSGERWKRAGKTSLWLLRARDWTLAGLGDDLASVRAEYLRNIKKDNRPTPLSDSWLSASVDWPMLATWAPLSSCPLKLARTTVEVTAAKGRMRAVAHVSYPQAVAWKAEPWHIPKGLVGGPLSSFTAARDLSPYLNSSDVLSRLSNNPLPGQIYCWALRAMAMESYAAWPVTDATNVLQKLGTEAPPVLNPILEARDHTHLNWSPQKNQLLWIGMPATDPILQAAHDASGDFLLAKVFPLPADVVPAPAQLFSQFEGRDDLIYYDWELTGLRLQQWRLLSELLPIFPSSTYQDSGYFKQTKQAGKPGNKPKPLPNSLIVAESWLASMTLPPGNTVTEVTRTSPSELTVIRNSQFLFTGLEWVLLSHWLADAPVGPVDLSLLPRAKITGPGMPH
jgi:hypothetical protein